MGNKVADTDEFKQALIKVCMYVCTYVHVSPYRTMNIIDTLYDILGAAATEKRECNTV